MQTQRLSIEEMKKTLSGIQELSAQIEVLNSRDSEKFRKEIEKLTKDLEKLDSSHKSIDRTGFWSKANYALGYLAGYDSKISKEIDSIGSNSRNIEIIASQLDQLRDNMEKLIEKYEEMRVATKTVNENFITVIEENRQLITRVQSVETQMEKQTKEMEGQKQKIDRLEQKIEELTQVNLGMFKMLQQLVEKENAPVKQKSVSWVGM